MSIRRLASDGKSLKESRRLRLSVSTSPRRHALIMSAPGPSRAALMNKIKRKASDSRSHRLTKKALCSFADSKPDTGLWFLAARPPRYCSMPKCQCSYEGEESSTLSNHGRYFENSF